MNNTYADNWIATHSGLKFYPGQPEEAEIDIEDVAHALSNLCRFAGHCREFYSVAQHSVIVSKIVPPHRALCALMHDAPEAYLCDLPRGVKALLPAYKQMEAALWRRIAGIYGFLPYLPPEIKDADNIALVTERRDLIEHPVDTWLVEEKFQALEETIIPLPPGIAKQLFLDRYEELTQNN